MAIKLVGLALVVIGAILLYFGINATQSFTEELGEAFTGRYSDETMWYLIGGGVCAVLGVAALLMKR